MSTPHNTILQIDTDIAKKSAFRIRKSEVVELLVSYWRWPFGL